ncbi:MAG: TlpA family protein disulfide reductase [Bacteroidia bacterium]|nr:TlpA family protein disulfide reductase [Bacteroidia bacterium]
MKKHLWNVVFVVLVVLLLIPQTGKPIKVFVNRLIAFSPSVEQVGDREVLDDYDWNLQSTTGELVNLADFKGKKIVINFWATWCPPCIAEMPSMQALYTSYQDDVVFLFVTNDEIERVKHFLKKENLNIPVYTSLSGAPDMLASSRLPTTYILNEAGEIVVEKTGSANWNSETIHQVLEQ